MTLQFFVTTAKGWIAYPSKDTLIPFNQRFSRDVHCAHSFPTYQDAEDCAKYLVGHERQSWWAILLNPISMSMH
jgi:hypothetical protein